MNAIAVLYGASLDECAFEELDSGKSAFLMSAQRAAALDGVSKVVLFARDGFDRARIAPFIERLEIILKPEWNSTILLEALCKVSAGFDLIYYAWADAPLLDAELARAIKTRLTAYAAEYGYADGLPDGIAPEALLPATAVFLAKIDGGAALPVARDTLFKTLQKDINSFDIETEIAAVDLRAHRLLLAANSRRNLLLIRRFLDAGWQDYHSAEALIAHKNVPLRTLPAFFPIMVSDVCPQACQFCPYTEGAARRDTPRFMPLPQFEALLDAIVRFAGDAVIDLSLWGELALHPERTALIAAVLKRRELSLIIETCGVGWQSGDLDALAALVRDAAPRRADVPALSWIVSLDAAAPERYRALHGEGFDEASGFANALLDAFTGSVYVQALRVRDAEDDLEAFYRAWKKAGAEVIIQKYDDFCGALPNLRAGDISPLTRNPCWHLMRDMPILIDGTVPLCRESILQTERQTLGNAFSEALEIIWERGAAFYDEHRAGRLPEFCERCDEYYTYNF